MRICILTPTFLPTVGGIETSVDAMCREFLAQGHAVHVVAQRARGGQRTPELPYPVTHFRRPWSSQFGLGGMRRLLERLHRETPFDVLHAMVAHPTGCAALDFHRRSGVHLVITPRGHDIWERSLYRQRPAIWRRIARTLREAPMVTAIGAHFAELIYETTGGRRVPIIHNGVSLAALRHEARRPVSPVLRQLAGRPFILGLGRLVEQKGFDVLLRAFARVAPALADHHLVIGGDGPLREPLARLSRELGLGDRVHWPGPVVGDDKLFLLQHSALVAIPSRYEGYCNVVLEAMACGRPVVATRIPSLTEAVHEGYNGALGELDDPGSIAQAMLRVVEPAALPRLQAGIDETAEAHDWPSISRQYLETYSQPCRVAV